MNYSIIKLFTVCVALSLYLSNTVSAQEDLDFDLPDISIFDDAPTQTAQPQSNTTVAPQNQQQSEQVVKPQIESQQQVVPVQTSTQPVNQQQVETKPTQVQPTSVESSDWLPPVESVVAEPKVENVQVQSVQQAPAQKKEQVYTKPQAPSVQPWSKRGWGIGIGGGPNLFYGDLGIAKILPTDYANELNFAGTFFLQKELVQYVDLRGQLLYGTLSGVKATDKLGNSLDLRFDATVFEYNANVKINISNAIIGRVAPISLYSYVGMGFSTFRTYSTNTVFNTVENFYGYDGTTKYKPTIETMVPVGVGLEFKITDNLFVNTDVSMRFVNTDKLDAYKGTTTQFLQDMYSFSSIGITYTFGKKQTVVPQQEEPAYIPPVVKDEPKEDTTKVDSLAMVDSAAVKALHAADNAGTSKAGNVAGAKTSLSDTDVFKGQDKIVKAEDVTKPKQDVVRVTNVGELNSNPQAVPGLVYRVQILAVQNQQNAKLQEFKKRYNITDQVYEEKVDSWYKFTVGNFATLQEAGNYRQILVNKGIQGAFVVTYYNGKRITLQQARELQAK